MPKLNLNDLTNLENQPSAIATINANNALIEEALQVTLSRDGTSPNEMVADIDMNSNRILNLPEPVADQEPMRKIDVSAATITELQAIAADAESSQQDAETAQVAAEAAQLAAESAQTASETAKLDAETAQTAAEAAQAAAETAQGLAEDAQTAAETAKTAAETAETNAETAETNASNSASAAATSETNAANSASAAATSETNANNSAVAAATSATDAANAFDDFDDRYLGSKSSDPALDNDGNALQAGTMYWSTSSTSLKIYDGSVWNTYSPSAGISNVVDDATPQLGGDLDLNGHVITGMVIGTNVQAYDADTAKLDTAQTWTAVQGYGETALTYTSGGTTSWDVSTAPVATVTCATGNTTMGAPSNVTAGRFYSIRIVQDTSPRTIAWNSAYKFIYGTAPTISTGSGAVDHIVFYGRSSNILEEVGRSQAVA